MRNATVSLTCIVSQRDGICAIVLVTLSDCKSTRFAVVNVIFVHCQSMDIVNAFFVFGFVLRFLVLQHFVNLPMPKS